MKTITNKGGNLDLRDLLLMAGAGQFTADMSIPYMNMLPTTTDPYAQGVLQIVKGLQTLLIQRGAQLTADGGLGENTVRALMAYAGPRWYDKSWAQLYGDVVDGRLWQSWDRESRADQAAVLATMPSRGGMSGLGATRFRTSSVAGLGGLGHTAYHHLGALTEIGAYCTVAHPYPGCTPIAGVAKPTTAEMLDRFTVTQRLLNALRAKQGLALIDVDGRIGPQTVDAMKRFADPGVANNTVDAICQNIDRLVDDLTTEMQRQGTSFVADPVPKSPPSMASGAGVINPPNSAIAATMGGGSLEKLLPIAAGVVGVLLVLKLSKKKGRR